MADTALNQLAFEPAAEPSAAVVIREEQRLILASGKAEAEEEEEEEQDAVNTSDQEPSLDDMISAAGFGWYQVKLFLVCGTGWAADIANLVVVSFLPDSIMKEWPSTSRVEASMPASFTFFGMLLGSVFWGMLADRRGRRVAFLWTCAIAAVFGLVSAAAPALWLLVLGRFITGFGLGGNLAVDFALFIEYVPSSHRGQSTVLLTCFATLGSTAWILIPTVGWRAHLAACALLSAATLGCRSATMESPHFLWNSGRRKEAHRVVEAVAEVNGTQLMMQMSEPVDVEEDCVQEQLAIKEEMYQWLTNNLSLLKSDRKLSKQAIMLALMWFWLSFGFYSYSMWLPTILIAKGASEQDKYRDVLLAGFAQLPGTVVAALLVNTLGRRVLLAVTLTGCALFTVLFAQVTPESFPTSMRSTGMGICSFVARLAGIAAPMVAGGLLENQGVSASLMFCATCYGIAAVCAMLLPTETSKVELGE